MKKALVITAILVIAATGGIYYAWWSSAVRQPAGFVHSQHVAQNIDCATCHGDSGEYFPQVDRCAGCHNGMKVPADVRWQRVYRIAPDVIFSHERHKDVACAECHPEMTSAKKVVHEYRYPMEFCMNCHAQRGAQNACAACHRNR